MGDKIHTQVLSLEMLCLLSYFIVYYQPKYQKEPHLKIKNQI